MFVVTILVIACILNFTKNKNYYLHHYKKYRFFYTILTLLLLHFTLTNFIHFGISKNFLYSLKENRWILYTLLIIPSIHWLLDLPSLKNERFFQSILMVFSILFISVSLFIFWDSLLKLLTGESTLAIHLSQTKFENPKLYGNRASWTYNPIFFSRLSYFFSLLFLGLGFYYKNLTLRLTTLFLSLGFFSIVFISQTRASFLGVFISAMTVFVLIGIYKNKKKGFALCTIFLTINFLSLNLFPQIKQRTQTIYNGTSFSKDHRIELWKANLESIIDHPLLGIGNFENRKSKIMSDYLDTEKLSTKYQDKRLYNHAHNTYLDIGSASGVPALILFIIVLLYPIYLILKRFKNQQDNLIDSLTLAFLLFITVVIFFDRVSYYNWLLVILAMGLALRQKFIVDDELNE